tara:strand:+ start:4539 stop:4754 length:216 start_codon:yes stop_codon:yes gene_type:complete
MATSLDKKVTRVTNATYRDKGKDRNIVVTLAPSGDNAYICMKLKGLRTEEMKVTVDVKSLYSSSLIRRYNL